MSQDVTHNGPVDFGGYSLVAPLGVTRTGGVFEARERATGSKRAVKLLDLAAVNEEAVKRFLAEARVLRRLHHPHVVRAYEHGRDQGFAWYAMDLLDGGSLHDLLKARGALAPEHALCAAFQVLRGLHALHEAWVVHRDIKLTNVLLDRFGRLCLADLGVAHHPAGTVEFHTAAGQKLGTEGYVAPEQWGHAREVGPPADIFAVGVLLFRLLTAKAPHVLHMGRFRPALLEKLPEPVRMLLLKATESEPEDRYPTARAMAAEVAQLLDVFGEEEVSKDWMASFTGAEIRFWRWQRWLAHGG